MASLSKREQARNEIALQDLQRLPGNSTCADCGARNPSWASWNLGIFLCMRCASIHRKLGTHISKVKSLSMDKWTTQQVESMKQQGNIASNKVYNPKNKKPDMPLDADEVDSAMERFIRKKYQEKSLVDGKPEPPSRTEVSPSVAQSPHPSPNPGLTPTTGKKHKFFGFSLRTSSKKDRPGVQDAFKVTPVEYSPTSGRVRVVPELELQEKVARLRDMGFGDNEQNLNVLKRSGGDLERAIAALVKLGPSGPLTNQSSSAAPREEPSAPASSTAPAASTSNNPFDQLRTHPKPTQESPSFGLSFGASPEPTQPAPNLSANPWLSAMPSQQVRATGLEQQLSAMQVSNPLFPHHTGGYAQPSAYQDPRMQSMTPPVPSMPQQFANVSSPTATLNPFYQQPLSSQSTGNNPFLQNQQFQPSFAPQTQNNPFFGVQQPQPTNLTLSSNPFGLPPAQSQAQQPLQQHVPSPAAQTQSTNPFGIPPQASPPPIQQSQIFPPIQSYTQTAQYDQQQAPQVQQFYQNPQLPQQQSMTLQPQATGRYTKTDIMALFQNPSPAFQQQVLAPVQESQETTAQASQPHQQRLSVTPGNNPYGALSPAGGKRSATMPVMSSMYSSGGVGSRNPFVSQPSSTPSSSISPAATPFGQQQQIQAQPWNQVRHASNESVSVNNPGLMDGRHSPDAFANLSARY